MPECEIQLTLSEKGSLSPRISNDAAIIHNYHKPSNAGKLYISNLSKLSLFHYFFTSYHIINCPMVKKTEF